jgi:fatty-acyl-CoA synthase
VPANGGRLTGEELTDLCSASLAAYKVPRVFRQVGELPRSATGKVRRKDAAVLFAD